MGPSTLPVLVAILCFSLGCSAPSSTSSPEGETAALRSERWGGLSVVTRGSGDDAVVLLHGYGASGDDLVPLAETLAEDVEARFVMPAAPFARPGGGRMWFERWGRAQARQVTRSSAALDGVVATLRREGARRVVLAGFSQGAMMSLERALHGTSPVDALVLLSGAAPAELGPDFSALQGVPVFVAHGRQDTVLPFSGGEEMARRAEEAGARVTFVTFEGGHTIPAAVVDGVRAFLRQAL